MYSILIASALNKKKLLNVKVLTAQDSKSNYIKFYKSFGINDFVYSFNFKNKFEEINTITQSLFYFVKFFFIISFKSFDWFIENFDFKGIKIGDLIYDTFISNEHNFIKPKKNFFFYKIVFLTIYKVLKILKLIKKDKIKYIIVGTANYANYDALCIRVGLQFNIKILEAGYFHNNNALIEYKKNHIKYGLRHIFFDNKQKLKLNKLKISEKKLDRFIKNRFSNKIKLYHTNNLDVKLANKSKNFYSKDKFLLKFSNKNFNKIVIFAPHAFSDAPHGGGYELHFRDFYEYFTETINQIKKSPSNILWIIRPHPLSKKYGEKNIVENYLKTFQNRNIILCPKNITTQNLIQICDTVITMKGTIGLEFASSGKKPITCGYPPYSNFGITLNSYSKTDFFSKLNNINKLNFKLTKREKLLAKKILFYMETMIPYREMKRSQFFQNFVLPLNSNESDLNWRRLENKFKSEIDFNRDKFYIDCLNKL